MNKVRMIVDVKKCTGSGECVKVCPENAITIVDGIAVIDHSKCDYDGLCIPACPCGAISFSEDEKISSHPCGNCDTPCGNKI